jgi:hypothetical protein
VRGASIHFIEEAGLWLSVRAGELALRHRSGRYADLDRRIKTIVAAGHGFAVTNAAIRHCSAKHIELLISDDAATFVSLFAPTSAANSSRAAVALPLILTIALLPGHAEQKDVRKNPQTSADTTPLQCNTSALRASCAAFAAADTSSNPADAGTPCGPYMAARTCLGAIEHEAKDCIATKFPNGATSAEVLQCLNEAIGKTGATSGGLLPDSRAMPPAGRQEPRSGGVTVDLDGGVLQ